jgi:alkylhydroperoxidase family enzyme
MGTPAGTGTRDGIAELRAVVGNTSPAPEAMDAYLEKVRLHAYRITDADVEELKAAGIAEDTIFEQTVAAAISEGLYRLDAAAKVIDR